jgi:hypothetical protein
MHPYLSADIAAAHVADLVREAAARCCSVAARHPVVDRVRAIAQRATAALHRATGAATPACCPA